MVIPTFLKSTEDYEYHRHRWDSVLTFQWAGYGSCIGLGNILTFPVLCAKWGGFAFFGVPYLIFLFFVGIPLLVLELGLG